MERERIELDDASVCELIRDFVPGTQRAALFAALLAEVPFEAREIRIYGRAVMQPRRVAYVGDADAVYTYSRTRHEPLPWTATLASLREDVSDAAGEAFNAVLCNLYRDGQDSMGMHRDQEPELGLEPVIASLSLGATRKFQIRPSHSNEPRVDLALTDGSLLVMRGAFQHRYRHGVPKEPRVTAPRINLTFRRVLGSGRA